MRKLLLSLGILFFVSNALSNKPMKFNLSQEEQQQMQREADDFIDALPEGFQDRLGDAVSHAVTGATGDLQKLRNTTSSCNSASPDVRIEEINANGIKMCLYSPKDRNPESLLIFFHGGGWSVGGLNSSAHFCDSLVSTGKISVLNVDYSLSPEKKFPSGLIDCINAVKYASSKLCHSDNIHINLGGEGAGANLALATTLFFLNDSDKKIEINSLLLFYPILELSSEKTGSWKKYARGYGLNRRLLESFVDAYSPSFDSNTGSNEEFGKYYIFPSTASDRLLSQLPPTMIINAERDILTDQCERFVLRLTELGGKANHIIFPGAVHSFISVIGQPTAFRKSVEFAEEFLIGE